MTPEQAFALHDELLATAPEGSRHDSTVCPICVDKAQATPPSDIPPGVAGSGETPDNNPTSTEGGTNKQMTDISKETHEALLAKAISDAVSATDAANASLSEQNASLAAERDRLAEEKAALLADNERLNSELDKAQVSLKTVTDEVAALKADIAAKDEAARKAEIASARATQVKNLGLFPEAYIAEKASRWADVDEAEWTERVDEWKAAKTAPVADASTTQTDAASALTGVDEAKDNNSKPESAKRAVLGLV